MGIISLVMKLCHGGRRADNRGCRPRKGATLEERSLVVRGYHVDYILHRAAFVIISAPVGDARIDHRGKGEGVSSEQVSFRV